MHKICKKIAVNHHIQSIKFACLLAILYRMKPLKQSISTFSLSQKLFALGVFLFALPSLWWLFNTWAIGTYDTAGIWGGLSLLTLIIWSAKSKRASCRKENKTLIFSLFAIASILQFSSIGINIDVLRGLSLLLDCYSLSLWLGLRYRQNPLSPEWLLVLLAFSFPIDLPGTGVNTLVFTGSTLAILMAVARPSLIKSIISLGLLSGLAVLGSSLRFYFDANGGIMEAVALAPEIITVLVWFLWIYKKPSKPHPFKDITCWSVPKSIKQDSWWFELRKRQRLHTAKVFASIVFVMLSALSLSMSNLFSQPEVPLALSSLELK